MLPQQDLENEYVKLTPLASGEWKQFEPDYQDADLWTYFPYDLSTQEAFSQWMQERVQFKVEGKWLPYLVFFQVAEKYAGLSCYLNIDEPNKSIEIGGTWYLKKFHGTVVNPACKLLLMTHAFEVLDMKRVEFKTDVLNVRSRRAIEKLGASEEGILRSNRIVQNNRRRDTVYYSVLADEWPRVKQGLLDRIASYE